MGGFPDRRVEELDFVAAEFLHAGAADRAVGLGQDFGARAIAEGDGPLGHFSGQEVAEVVGQKSQGKAKR